MITGVRAILFCDEVRADEDGVSLIGAYGVPLMAQSRPGFMTVTLFAHLDVDITATQGAIRIEAGAFDEAFRFNVTTDRQLTAMVLPIMLPVLKDGLVRVTIADDAHRKKTWVYRWPATFTPDAQVIGEEAGVDILASAREAAKTVRNGLVGPGAVRIN